MVFADQELARRLEESEALGMAAYPQAQKRLAASRAAGSVAASGAGSNVASSASFVAGDGEGRGLSDAAAEQFGGGYAIFAGVDSPLSRAVGLGLDGPFGAYELERVEQFYLSRGASVIIDVCPLVDESLVRLLGRRDYRVMEFHNIWFRPLGEDERFARPLDGLEVREAVADEAALWINTVTRGFAGRDELSPGDTGITSLTFSIPETRCFLASLAGEPVGGGVLVARDGLASLFSGSTVVKARGRGVQRALIEARLDAAVAAGCDMAVIKTTPGTASQRNVERAGFRLAYTRSAMIREPKS